MNRKIEKPSLGIIMIRIACALFCLVLISTSMMSGLYARYTARGEGTDNARVAKFIVGGELSPKDVTVDIGEGETEGLFVLVTQNTSEVAVKYDVVVEATLPAGVNIFLDDAIGTLLDGKYTFTNVDKLAPILDSGSHELRFIISDVNDFTSPATDKTYSQEIDFTVTVKFVQID